MAEQLTIRNTRIRGLESEGELLLNIEYHHIWTPHPGFYSVGWNPEAREAARVQEDMVLAHGVTSDAVVRLEADLSRQRAVSDEALQTRTEEAESSRKNLEGDSRCLNADSPDSRCFNAILTPF